MFLLDVFLGTFYDLHWNSNPIHYNPKFCWPYRSSPRWGLNLWHSLAVGLLECLSRCLPGAQATGHSNQGEHGGLLGRQHMAPSYWTPWRRNSKGRVGFFPLVGLWYSKHVHICFNVFKVYSNGQCPMRFFCVCARRNICEDQQTHLHSAVL